jgi:uncharacterized protein YggE
MSPTLDRRHAIASLAGIGMAGVTSARLAVAQASPTVEEQSPVDPLPGIVVPVTGRASAPADRAIGQLIVRAQYGGPKPIDAASEAPVNPLATPEVPVDVIAMMVDALVEAGVDQANILTTDLSQTSGSGYFGPGSAVVVFQVEGEGIKTLGNLLTMLTGIVTEQGLIYDQPGAMLLSDACQDLRGQAYADAVEVGRQEAELIAGALGVELGELIRAAKQSVSFGPAAYGMYPGDSCDNLVDLGTAVRTYLPPFDASLPNEFTVYAMIELTFAIN